MLPKRAAQCNLVHGYNACKEQAMMSHACPTEPPRPRGITTKDMQETYSTSRNGEFPSLFVSNDEKKGKKKNYAVEEKDDLEEDEGPHNSPLHIPCTSYAQLFVPRLFSPDTETPLGMV